MNAASRARLLSMAVLAVVFGSGIVVGFAWDRRLDAAEAAERLAERSEAEAESDAPSRDEVEDAESRPRYMWERVEPTEAQRVLLDSIMRDHWQQSREFHKESRRVYDEGMRALVVQTREAIKGVLDRDQAARYDSLATARDNRNRRDDDDDDGRGN